MLVNCNWLSLIVIKRDQLYELRSIPWIAIDSLNCDRLPELRSIIWVVIDCTSCDLLYELQHCPTILRIGSVTIGLLYSQTRWTASFISSSSSHRSPVRYDLTAFLCTIRSGSFVGLVSYDINLEATHTTILSIRGVQIPIYLASSATDFFRSRVVLFKPVRIPTSDLKSEFLCQSSYIAQNL